MFSSVGAMSLHNQSTPNTPNNAEELLAYIQAHLPQLWRLQHNGGTRCLRTILNAVERMNNDRDRPGGSTGPADK